MQSDAELLRSYAQGRSESAFTELVRRHINLVYSAALRETGGDASLAEDITQTVFIQLARNASSLVRHPALAGWMYTCVRRKTANARRMDDRRQRREQGVQTMNELLCAGTSESDWRQIQPVLDDAMHELSETDRAAVVLRFFEGQNLKEIGLALGLKENAARMRVDRALEKLQTLLAKRGIKSTAGGLAAAIAAGAVVSAPTGLAASVATGALTLTASTASTAFTAIKLMTMTKLKVGLISAVVVAGVAMQYQTQVGLREENQSLRKQAVQMARIAEENRRLAAMVARADGSQSLSKDQLSELMKLRGEVGLLRKQNGELEKLREENRRAQASPSSPGQGSNPGKSYTVDEYQKEAGIAKLNYAKYCVLALQLYAEKNQGWFPASFDQALAYLPEEARTEMNLAPNEFLPYTPKFGLTPDRFELVYAGALADIATPASVIVFREREAWGENGRWNRTYGFADGHSEIHFSPDGNFDAWEKQHRTAPAPPGP